MAEGGDTIPKVKLQWREAEKAPRAIDSSYGAAVVCGTMIYFYHMSDEIRSYDTRSNKWTSIPSPSRMGYSLAFVNNKLTAIGGGYFLHYTNKLYSLSGEGIDLSWNEDFQPMPTKRGNTIALTTATSLIVAGGNKTGSIFGDTDSRSVEVMNTQTFQWSIAAPFPTSLYDSSVALCNGSIYVAAMRQLSDSNPADGLLPTRQVYTCSVNDLLQSCSRPLLAHLASALSLSARGVWKRVADLPVTETACVNVCGHLLAVGGRETNDDATTAIHMYDPESDSWEAISHMSTPRTKCFAAVLPNSRLMVVGGCTTEGAIVILGHKRGNNTDSVEMASVEG